MRLWPFGRKDGPERATDRQIRNFLQGKMYPTQGPLADIRPGWAGGDYLRLCGSGYMALLRVDGTNLMSLDNGILLQDDEEEHWRHRITRLAAEVGAQVIPVSLQAFRKLHGRYPKLVHRKWNEAVFTTWHDGEQLYWLSGYDTQEHPPLYFLCGLPHPVSSVEEARRALKPASVVAAEAAGRKVLRQGDLFAIETDFTEADVHRMGKVSMQKPLYGTAHYATWVCELPDGVMLASDAIVHKPQFRDPDHKVLELGGRWWVVARNTVPVRAPVAA